MCWRNFKLEHTVHIWSNHYWLYVLVVSLINKKQNKKTLTTKMLCAMFVLFLCAQSSSIELLKKLCEVVEWGLGALAKHVPALLPQDGSAIIDPAFMQVGS